MIVSASSEVSIPFHWFVLLINRLGSVSPTRRGKSTVQSPKKRPRRLEIIREWVQELRTAHPQLSPTITTMFFRFLFPNEDSRRRYNMKEATLAKTMCQVFGLHGHRNQRAKSLMHWDSSFESKDSSGTGCLGDEIRNVFIETFQSSEDQQCKLSFQHVDELLNELASKKILKDLFGKTCASGARVLIQIILRDLRPILYPLKELHSTPALLHFDSTSSEPLTKHEVMKEWDPTMRQPYQVQECSASLSRSGQVINPDPGSIGLVLGVSVEIPKCRKGRDCSDALKNLANSKDIWVETKYDGERMQIHLDLRLPPGKQIRIFSKSKRDSTKDRFDTHSTILAAVSGAKEPIKETAILEAEMVAYSISKGRIEEFWRIRDILARGPSGPRQAALAAARKGYKSDDAPEGDLHLMLVFFDILYRDGSSCLNLPYEMRRATLEAAIAPQPQFVMLADRYRISSTHSEQREDELREIFAMHLSKFEEGVVLKAGESRYHDWHLPWVKLKRDYIPGYGDTADLIAFGASWDKDRGRELRVAPGTLTTFYIGLLDVTTACAAPHIQFLFTVSYGLERKSLEQLNFAIRSMENSASVPFTYKLRPDIPAPSVLLNTPILMELFGAGFTKSDRSDLYELRFPRIAKFFSPLQRGYSEAISLSGFQELARRSVGGEKSDKDIEDSINRDWNKPTSPNVRSPRMIKRRASDWTVVLKNFVRSPPKANIRTLSSGFLLSSSAILESPHKSPKNPHSTTRSPVPPLTSVKLNLLPEVNLSASETRYRSPFYVKRRASVSPSPSPAKRLRKHIGISNQGQAHCKENTIDPSAATFREGPVTILSFMKSPRHHDRDAFFDPRRNEFIYSPLARFLIKSQVWIDPSNAYEYSPQVMSFVPPGQLTYLLDALLLATGLDTESRFRFNSKNASEWPGVLFVAQGNEESVIARILPRLKTCQPEHTPRLTIFPRRFLAYPPSTSDQLREGIIWQHNSLVS